MGDYNWQWSSIWKPTRVTNVAKTMMFQTWWPKVGVGQLGRNGEQGEPGKERAEQGDRGLPRQEHKVQPRDDQGGCFIQNWDFACTRCSKVVSYLHSHLFACSVVHQFHLIHTCSFLSADEWYAGSTVPCSSPVCLFSSGTLVPWALSWVWDTLGHCPNAGTEWVSHHSSFRFNAAMCAYLVR